MTKPVLSPSELGRGCDLPVVDVGHDLAGVHRDDTVGIEAASALRGLPAVKDASHRQRPPVVPDLLPVLRAGHSTHLLGLEANPRQVRHPVAALPCRQQYGHRLRHPGPACSLEAPDAIRGAQRLRLGPSQRQIYGSRTMSRYRLTPPVGIQACRDLEPHSSFHVQGNLPTQLSVNKALQSRGRNFPLLPERSFLPALDRPTPTAFKIQSPASEG